jgi:hypothetical protein
MSKSIIINYLNNIIHLDIVAYEIVCEVCGNEIVGWGSDK